jgi:hypothetical protein
MKGLISIRRAVFLCLLIPIAALALGVTTASADPSNAYLYGPALPTRCPVAWQSPDPSVSTCWARFFVPSIALTTQSVLLRIGDYEASFADCSAFSSSTTTTFQLDGAFVPITNQPCRYLPLDTTFGQPVWRTDYRYLIPAGSLSPGDHTITWTSTFNSGYSYSLGCSDPSGRCPIPAGTVQTSTVTLTIITG